MKQHPYTTHIPFTPVRNASGGYGKQQVVAATHQVPSGSPSGVSDYWQQCQQQNPLGESPSKSWSADSTHSSSSDSSNIDGNRKRSERKAWRPPQPVYMNPPAPPGYMIETATTIPSPTRKMYRPTPKHLGAWSTDRCVALDAEMVGVGPYGQDSSVARVVLVNWRGRVLFDEYIQQTQPVTDYRTFVSGITPEHLADATLSLRDARKQILKILYGRLLIGHALKNDLKALGISHPWWLLRDTARYEPFMQTFDGRGPEPSALWPRKLKDLCWEKLGSDIQTYGKPHSPYEDAMAALNLYKTVRVEWEKIMRKKVSKTHEIQTEERNFQERLAVQQQWAYRQQQIAYMQHMQQQQHMIWQCQQQQKQQRRRQQQQKLAVSQS